MSASVWRTRSGERGSSRQRTRRSAIPSRRSMSASTSTPASEVRQPPSKATCTPLPAIDDEPNRTTAPSTTAVNGPWSCRPSAAWGRLRPWRWEPDRGDGVDVGAWLRGLGLERYEQAFRDNDVDAEVLPELTAEDLIGLGIGSIGHRRKLLATIAALRASELPPSRSADVHVAPSPAMPPPAAGAERRQLTVMFADLVGSTALASRLDPEEMRDLLRGYQNTVAGEVARFGGHVAKFLGDGVLAYFGWPRADEHDAERAVRAGLAVVAAVPAIRAPDGEPLAARVGIASGLV